MLELKEILRARARHDLQEGRNSSKKKSMRSIRFFLSCILLFSIASVGWFHLRVRKIEIKQKAFRKTVKILKNRTFSTNRYFGDVPVPTELSGVPFAEDLKIVLSVKEVDIRNIIAPYNPSIIKSSSGYDLFFRYDVLNPSLKYAPFSSRIGVVSLNERFEQEGREFKRIDLRSEYADDPRVLKVDDQLFLFYNKLDEIYPKCRFMCISNLDPNTYDIKYSTVLNMNINWIEKNWSPFAYIGDNHKPELFFEYRINPRKVLHLPNTKINELNNISVPTDLGYLSLAWPAKWGGISGGTPALKVGDEYLGFFHSWFTDKNKIVWYVMGAYTFNPNPPFNLTSISRHPILFKGIYETPLSNTASIEKRVIFPSGFLVEKQNDKELIHLSCGENDCGVKIITIDKEELLKSLLRFIPKQPQESVF
jgi:predicted GH43/DUF377 family glycosyl hydrolase